MVGFVRSEACAGLIDADEASPVRELAAAAGAAGTGTSREKARRSLDTVPLCIATLAIRPATGGV